MTGSLNTIGRRGAFIVFEGCDRCGKTTQSKKIVEFLQSKGINAKYMNFPARDTPSGAVIDSYLKNKQDLSDEGIHLLFAVNRWEAKKEMEKLLRSGTTLIVDRYSYSGVAYSAAKGLDYKWCKTPEVGLLKPDLVFYLNASLNVLSNRAAYGSERYEKAEFLKKVGEVFSELYKESSDYWVEVDASKSFDDVHLTLKDKVLELIQTVKEKPLTTLWE